MTNKTIHQKIETVARAYWRLIGSTPPGWRISFDNDLGSMAAFTTMAMESME